MPDENNGCVVWITGLSGAGKSTISSALKDRLSTENVEVLDGDEVRENLSKGLGFSKEDRDTNVKRIGYVAKLLSRNGVIVIVAAISPYQSIREEVRNSIKNFIEVYCECPIDTLKQRDPKGLYKKVARGEIKNFTGISDPYEPPLNPDVHLKTHEETLEESVDKVMQVLYLKGTISII